MILTASITTAFDQQQDRDYSKLKRMGKKFKLSHLSSKHSLQVIN